MNTIKEIFFARNSHLLRGKFDTIVIILFLALIMLRYPLLYSTFFYNAILTHALYTTDLISLSAFSIFMTLLKYKEIINFTSSTNRIFRLSIILFFIIIIVQFYTFDTYTLREFCFSISWVVIPLAIYLYFNIFKKLITPLFSFLWCFNFIHTTWQILHNNECVGISGNRNWHGCLLIVTTPFVIYSIYKFFKRKYVSNKIILIIESPIIIFTLIALYKVESRAANLALIVTTLLFIILTFAYSLNHFIKKYKTLFFSIFIISIILLTIIAPLFFGNKMGNIIYKDVRIPLWRGAINMFLDSPMLGVGSASYEASYSYYRPIEYYLRSHYFANRPTHPHNQLLYFAGSFGIFGLLTLSLLWFYPILYFMKKYKQFSFYEKLIFFTFIMLSIHGMLDLVMVRWPTMQLFFILQGSVWGCISYNRKKSQYSKFTPLINNKINLFLAMISFILCYIFLLSTIYIIYSNIKRSYYDRSYKIALLKQWYTYAIVSKEKAIESNCNPRDLYDAGIQAMLTLSDYRLGYKYFSKLEKHPMKIIVHSNLRTADCLMQMGRKNEALQYLKKESTMFPLSSLPLYSQILLERELGKTNDAEKTAFKLIQQLKFKGLQLSDMKKILANPKLDNKFHLINNSKQKK